MNAEKFEVDDDVAADRTPAACPFCGHDGAFGGLGRSYETVTFLEDGDEQTFRFVWYQHRCGECNGRFKTVERVMEQDQ